MTKTSKSFTFNLSKKDEKQVKVRDDIAVAGCTRVFVEELGNVEFKTDNTLYPGNDDGFFC